MHKNTIMHWQVLISLTFTIYHPLVKNDWVGLIVLVERKTFQDLRRPPSFRHHTYGRYGHPNASFLLEPFAKRRLLA